VDFWLKELGGEKKTKLEKKRRGRAVVLVKRLGTCFAKKKAPVSEGLWNTRAEANENYWSLTEKKKKILKKNVAKRRCTSAALGGQKRLKDDEGKFGRLPSRGRRGIRRLQSERSVLIIGREAELKMGRLLQGVLEQEKDNQLR